MHKKSDDGLIYYLGTQYQIMWPDHNCPKGFHIFDTETRELERIPNDLAIFKKIIVNKILIYTTLIVHFVILG